MNICSKASTGNVECQDNDYNECTGYTSNVQTFLMCPTTCQPKSFSVGLNDEIPYEFENVGRLDLCYYHIYANKNLDIFKVKLGEKKSRVQYTLFEKGVKGELVKIDNYYQGELRVYSKNHKEFILLALPMEKNAQIKFMLKSGTQTENSDRETHIFLLFFLIFLVFWILAIAGILIYIFFFKHKSGYAPQIDPFDTLESYSNETSARNVPPEYFTSRGNFGISYCNYKI